MPRHIIEDEVVVFTAFGGDWDASSGAFPATANQGDIYRVSVSGTVDSITFYVGDLIMVREISTGPTDYASSTTFSPDWEHVSRTNPDEMSYKGDWAVAGGVFPGGGTAAKGDMYRADATGIVDGVSFVAGDLIVARQANASTATYANNWQAIPTSGSAVSKMIDADTDTQIRLNEGATDSIDLIVDTFTLANLDASINGMTLYGDLRFDSSLTGVILKSPNGQKWRLLVDDAGSLFVDTTG